MKTYNITRVCGTPDWNTIPTLQVEERPWTPETDIRMIQQICYDECAYLGINNMMMLLGRRANCGGAVLYTDNYHDYSHAYKIVEG